jgi:hypothetical protein
LFCVCLFSLFYLFFCFLLVVFARSYSVTKGLAASVVHLLVERGQLALDTPVAHYWPEFAAGGKGDITVTAPAAVGLPLVVVAFTRALVSRRTCPCVVLPRSLSAHCVAPLF